MVDESKEQRRSPDPARPIRTKRTMSRQMAIYYSNCAMIATSPKDISLFFGRYVPSGEEGGEEAVIELYERQVYMTVEQAEELAQTLLRTLELIKSRKGAAGKTFRAASGGGSP